MKIGFVYCYHRRYDWHLCIAPGSADVGMINCCPITPSFFISQLLLYCMIRQYRYDCHLNSRLCNTIEWALDLINIVAVDDEARHPFSALPSTSGIQLLFFHWSWMPLLVLHKNMPMIVLYKNELMYNIWVLGASLCSSEYSFSCCAINCFPTSPCFVFRYCLTLNVLHKRK